MKSGDTPWMPPLVTFFGDYGFTSTWKRENL